MIFDIISSSCPLLLSSAAALYTEFAGVMVMFLEGLICFAGFTTYAITYYTGSLFAGILLSALLSSFLCALFYFIVYKFKAHVFISGIALNLLFGFMTSFLSVKLFGTRGVLFSEIFNESIGNYKSALIIFTLLSLAFCVCGILFLLFSKSGLYIRVSGYNSGVLRAKGVNPELYRGLSWLIAGFYAALAGSFLVIKVKSFVPNISSGRGWMALAAVFLGKKKGWKISLAVLIFCAADYFSSHIQNYIPGIPSSVLLALPYFVMLAIILVDR